MHSYTTRTGAEQKAEQKARLDEMARAKHERVLHLARIIGHAAATQEIWNAGEPAEHYIERLGFDMTKI